MPMWDIPGVKVPKGGILGLGLRPKPTKESIARSRKPARRKAKALVYDIKQKGWGAWVGSYLKDRGA